MNKFFKRKIIQKEDITNPLLSVKIFIIYHKSEPLFKNNICIPIQAGRSVKLENNGDDKTKLIRDIKENTIGDDIGDNISNLNAYFSEMTAIYWIYKNYESIGNPDIVGFMHYRTILMLHNYPMYGYNYLDNCGIETNHINHLLKSKKAITGFWVTYETVSQYNSYYKNNIRAALSGHDIIFYDRLFDILKENYHKDYKSFYKWSNEVNRGGPYKNLFIMRKKEFFKYCQWIFPILFDLHKEFENYEYIGPGNQKRNIAWIAELLTAYYFDKYIGIKNCVQKSAIRPIVSS